MQALHSYFRCQVPPSQCHLKITFYQALSLNPKLSDALHHLLFNPSPSFPLVLGQIKSYPTKAIPPRSPRPLPTPSFHPQHLFRLWAFPPKTLLTGRAPGPILSPSLSPAAHEPARRPSPRLPGPYPHIATLPGGGVPSPRLRQSAPLPSPSTLSPAVQLLCKLSQGPFTSQTPRNLAGQGAPGPSTSVPSSLSAPQIPFSPDLGQGLPLTLVDVAVAAPRDGHAELALRLGQAAQAEGVKTGQQLGLRLTPALQALLTHGAGV